MTSQIAYTITADQISDVAPIFYAAHRTPMFIGTPGIAKTAFVREAAKAMALRVGAHVEVREMHLASMSEVDVRGFLVPQGDKSVFTKPEFWSAVEANTHGILFLDEFPQATHEVQKAVAPLILEGRIGEYVLPPGWSVMLAGNGLDDGAGANSLLSHVINRVCMIKTKAPDVDVWCTWAAANNLPFEVIAFAKYRPNVVFDGDLPAAPDTPYCTPRSLHMLGDIANAYPGGIRAMVEEKAGMAIMNGQIGEGAASELSALVRTAINLPSYEQVIAKPDDTVIPTKPDSAYAMIMLVAVRAQLEHSEQVLHYLSRFPANYSITGVVSLVRRDRRFASAQKMREYVLANKELLKKFNRYITEAV